MCKLLLDGTKYHINYFEKKVTKVDNKTTILKTTVHIPRDARNAIMNELSKKHNHNNKIATNYLTELRTGKLGRTDTFSGITICGETWEQMVIDLNLKVERTIKHRKIGQIPSFAT